MYQVGEQMMHTGPTPLELNSYFFKEELWQAYSSMYVTTLTWMVLLTGGVGQTPGTAYIRTYMYVSQNWSLTLQIQVTEGLYYIHKICT